MCQCFKEFDRDYYKAIRTDYGFDGRNNSYIEYASTGDRYENLSPKGPYLRDSINNQKPTAELNNKENNSHCTKNHIFFFQIF